MMEAENGASALEAMSLRNADVVVVDMIMPVMGGNETISLLRRLYPATKIIAISGGGLSSEHLRNARTHGAERCLAKPFDSVELLGAIHDLLAGTMDETQRSEVSHVSVKEYSVT
jgi:CheY-like chemotaxis protein